MDDIASRITYLVYYPNKVSYESYLNHNHLIKSLLPMATQLILGELGNYQAYRTLLS